MTGQDTSGAAIVTLPGEIDFASQDRAYEQLAAALDFGATVVIADFTATAFCDVSAIGHLMLVRRRAAARGAEIRLVIPPGGLIHRLAKLMKADQVLPVYPSVARAVAAGPVRRSNAPVTPHRTARRKAIMADILDVIETDHLHIRRWQSRLGGQLLHLSDPAPRLELTTIWETITRLIDLHTRADDEICAPAVYGSALARETAYVHKDIRDLIGETEMQPPGSPRWRQLTATVLSAWSQYYGYEQHGPPAEHRRSADPAARVGLAHQWRAFREACIRDQSYPDASPQVPTCQLRLLRPAPPRLADPAFSPMGCTCQTCTDMLDRAFGPP